jgi:hypothetical protein
MGASTGVGPRRIMHVALMPTFMYFPSCRIGTPPYPAFGIAQGAQAVTGCDASIAGVSPAREFHVLEFLHRRLERVDDVADVRLVVCSGQRLGKLSRIAPR